MKRACLIGAGAILLAGPAAAQTVQFGGLLKGELGYVTNPFVSSGVTKGTGLAAVTFSPRLTYTEGRAVTTLSGSYNREEYLSTFGSSDSLNIGLTRADQLSAKLSSSLTAAYTTSNNAAVNFTNQVTDLDPRDIGRRTRTISGSAGLKWQVSAADSFSLGGNILHQSYDSNSANGLASNFTQYGANASYDHVLDSRTSVGVQGSVSIQDSDLYPRSRSYQPAIHAQRQLNAIWTLDAHLGLVLQQVDGESGTTTSLGYGAQLCGAYPRSHMCIAVDKSSAPSGFGGLRNNLSISANLSRDLTAHSRVSFAASYSDSQSNQRLTSSIAQDAKSVQANADYSHDISQRLSAGVGGRYQWRETSGLGGAGRSVAVTANITAKLGRL